MMVHFYKFARLLLPAILFPFLSAPLVAAETTSTPAEYTAVYKVMRNSKRLAKVTVQLSRQDDVWTLHGYTHDMKGLADLLNVNGVQTVTGRWQDGSFLPQFYDFSFSLVGYKNNWRAEFDWASGMVTTTSKSGVVKLPLESDSGDPFSLSLNISAFLDQDKPSMEINVIDEDEIKNHIYHAELEELVDTPIGCLETTRVKRIRNNAKRTSLVWYANDYNHVPVLMQHSKKNGNGLKLQIISLEIAGRPVRSAMSCDTGDSKIHSSGTG